MLPWKGLARQYNLDCSDATLRRALAKRGYHKSVACPKPFISESARQQRLEFIADYQHWSWEWQDVVWSDECVFSIRANNGKLWSFNKKEERYCSYTCQHRYRSGRTSFAIWAAVGWNYKSPLAFWTVMEQKEDAPSKIMWIKYFGLWLLLIAKRCFAIKGIYRCIKKMGTGFTG